MILGLLIVGVVVVVAFGFMVWVWRRTPTPEDDFWDDGEDDEDETDLADELTVEEENEGV